MYERFYGFAEKPFNATPDPKFLFMTPSHREALAHLMFGVQEQRGFLVLTGEVGTGKTTLLNTLLRRIDDSTKVAFIHNSTLTFDEILEYMLRDFGIADPGGSRVQRLMALNAFLIERCRAGLKTVVLFDEAQNLEPPILEQVRLLSNFETATDKLLQILLVGQPELKSKLQLPQLRQLKQRVGLRCSIRPLTADETKEYIRTRLRIAGAQDLKIFEDRAVQRIAEYAGGIPRVINMVCDHCLVSGYALRKRRIDRGIVERAIQYLEEGERPAERRPSPKAGWRWLIGTMAASTAAAAIFLTVHAASSVSIGESILDVARAAKAWLLP
jgi:general secretion pathway protein A